MKVLVNGGVSVSELDDWWVEAYTPQVQWALGDVPEHSDDAAWDAIGAEARYDLLEREIIPECNARDEEGVLCAGGGTDAGKHGTIDAELFHQPRGMRVLRAPLPAGSLGLSGAGCRQRPRRRGDRRLATRSRPLEGASGGYVYSAAVSAARPPADYTARVIPYHPGMVVPLEAARILWQR
jgi:hypothetical protein